MDINRTGGTTFYVSLLPEDFQNKCQLQEAHESSQVKTIVEKKSFWRIMYTYIHTIHRCKMNFLIFSFRGEVAQGAQFALPQVVVQVRLHKSSFLLSFFTFWDFCCLVPCFYLLFKNFKRKKQNNSKFS